jgi:aldose 1-epimerase
MSVGMSVASNPDPVLSLRAGELRVDLASAVGGSIARFFTPRAGGALHWLRPATAAALDARLPLKMGSFPLAPFCNRIRNGRSNHGVLPLAMAPNFKDSPHTLHGTAWQAPWQVVSHGDRQATLSYAHPAGGRDGWPYAFEAQQVFELSDEALTVTLSVTNRSTHDMPAGIGQHPYFPRTPQTRLRAKVDGLWDSDAELLPTGVSRPDWLAQLADGLPLSGVVLDNNFTGWRHTARVDWPETRTALEMRSDSPLDYFVVYCPPPGHEDGELFCMEPVSNCTDWMNLAAASVGDVGGTMLAPGRTLTGRMELRPVLSV